MIERIVNWPWLWIGGGQLIAGAVASLAVSLLPIDLLPPIALLVGFIAAGVGMFAGIALWLRVTGRRK